jgi:hypothetical protein
MSPPHLYTGIPVVMVANWLSTTSCQVCGLVLFEARYEMLVVCLAGEVGRGGVGKEQLCVCQDVRVVSWWHGDARLVDGGCTYMEEVSWFVCCVLPLLPRCHHQPRAG